MVSLNSASSSNEPLQPLKHDDLVKSLQQYKGHDLNLALNLISQKDAKVTVSNNKVTISQGGNSITLNLVKPEATKQIKQFIVTKKHSEDLPKIDNLASKILEKKHIPPPNVSRSSSEEQIAAKPKKTPSLSKLFLSDKEAKNLHKNLKELENDFDDVNRTNIINPKDEEVEAISTPLFELEKEVDFSMAEEEDRLSSDLSIVDNEASFESPEELKDQLKDLFKELTVLTNQTKKSMEWTGTGAAGTKMTRNPGNPKAYEELSSLHNQVFQSLRNDTNEINQAIENDPEKVHQFIKGVQESIREIQDRLNL